MSTSQRPVGQGAAERGAAATEFVMVSTLLILLTLTVIQIAVMVHVQNTLTDAASNGARFGVLQDRTAADGVERAQELIEGSVSQRYTGDISYEYLDSEGTRTLRITVEAQIPVLGLFPGVGSMEVTGHAPEVP